MFGDLPSVLPSPLPGEYRNRSRFLGLDFISSPSGAWWGRGAEETDLNEICNQVGLWIVNIFGELLPARHRGGSGRRQHYSEDYSHQKEKVKLVFSSRPRFLSLRLRSVGRRLRDGEINNQWFGLYSGQLRGME